MPQSKKPITDARREKNRLRRQKRNALRRTTKAKGKPQNGKTEKAARAQKERAAHQRQEVPVIKTDVRAGTPSISKELANVNKTIALVSAFDNSILWGPAVTFVTEAVQNGFLVTASSANDVIGAANYIFRILCVAAQGSAPLTESGPLWLVEMCKVLQAKSVKKECGEITYKLALDAPNENIPHIVPMGPSQYGKEYPFLQPDGSTVDGFPLSSIAVIPLDNGAAAWQEVIQYCQTSSLPQNRIVPFAGTAGMETSIKTVSGYAVPSVPQGGGFGGSGGISYQLGLEVPIFHPLLGAFLGNDQLNNETTVGFRSPSFVNVFAGDVMTATLMMSHTTQSRWGMKRSPRIKQIDFLEFGDVLAQFVSQLLTEFWKDAANFPEVTPASTQCPLTLQETLILLRNEVMGFFETQFALQGLYPIQPSGPADNQFIAYLSAVNTCPINMSGMKLPLSFVENLKTLGTRSVGFSEKNKHDVRWWWPQIGQYALDVLSTSDYNFTATQTGDGEIITPSFAPLPGVRVRKVDPKTGVESWSKVMLETVIDLIDGYDSLDGSYAYINDPPRLTSLAMIWNNWISQFDKYCDPLITMTKDGGVAVLSGIGMTRYCAPPPPTQEKRSRGFADDRVAKVHSMNSVYSNRICYADSSQGALYDATYNTFQRLWILPTFKLQSGSTSQNLANFQRQQDMWGETYAVSRTATGDNGVSLADLHAQYASKMIRSSTALQSDWVEFLQQQAALGHGGILSSLAAQWIGSTFGSTAGTIAGAVAGALPI